MQVEITAKGVFWQSKTMLPVGTVIEVEGDTMPAALVNKARPVVKSPEASAEKAEAKTSATGKKGDGPKPNEAAKE